MTEQNQVWFESIHTVHIQQQSAGLLHDDRSGSDVPAVDADLKKGLHCSWGHQTHVGGCSSWSTESEEEKSIQ